MISESISNNIITQIEEQQPDTSKPKIIPTFGKKGKTNAINKHPKSKKFVPPTKISTAIEKGDENATKNIDKNCTTSEKLPSFNETFHHSNVLSNEINYLENLTLNDYDLTQNYNNGNLDNNYTNISLPKNSINKGNSFSGILTGSYNILNDENIILSQSSTHNFNISALSKSNSINEQSQNGSQNSDKFVHNLGQKEPSIASLKVYKDLDAKSFENKTTEHKIPLGDDFLNLFKDKIEKKHDKYIAMSVMSGDMGFNMKYSDFIKNSNTKGKENSEGHETYEMILKMYQKDNKKLIGMKKKKK